MILFIKLWTLVTVCVFVADLVIYKLSNMFLVLYTDSAYLSILDNYDLVYYLKNKIS